MRDTFMDRMAIGKDNAKRDRDRGGSSVRVYRSTAALVRARGGDREGWEGLCERASASFQGTAAQAIEDLRAALYGDTWEGF